MKIKKLLFIMLLMEILILPTVPVKAALQSNGGTPATYNIQTYPAKIRMMEALGGTLGLEDTINSSTLKSTAATPNNLDIHMEKNTEYGAMAILSASSYGKPDKVDVGDTTTGNATGVVMGNYEQVCAGGYSNTQSSSPFWTQYSKRYKNQYTSATINAVSISSKKGDATIETLGWYNGYADSYLQSKQMHTFHGLLRCVDNIFSVTQMINSNKAVATRDATNRTRAVIVCGANF